MMIAQVSVNNDFEVLYFNLFFLSILNVQGCSVLKLSYLRSMFLCLLDAILNEVVIPKEEINQPSYR